MDALYNSYVYLLDLFFSFPQMLKGIAGADPEFWKREGDLGRGPDVLYLRNFYVLLLLYVFEKY